MKQTTSWRISPEIRQRVWLARHEGVSYRDLGDRFRFSNTTVQRLLIEQKAANHLRCLVDGIKQLLARGLPRTDVATMFHLTVGQVLAIEQGLWDAEAQHGLRFDELPTPPPLPPLPEPDPHEGRRGALDRLMSLARGFSRLWGGADGLQRFIASEAGMSGKMAHRLLYGTLKGDLSEHQIWCVYEAVAPRLAAAGCAEVAEIQETFQAAGGVSG